MNRDELRDEDDENHVKLRFMFVVVFIMRMMTCSWPSMSSSRQILSKHNQPTGPHLTSIVSGHYVQTNEQYINLTMNEIKYDRTSHVFLLDN